MFIEVMVKWGECGVPFIPILQWSFVLFSLRFCFFLSVFFPAWEYWRLWWKVTSEVSQLAPSIKTSCSATKSCQIPPPHCLPQNPVSVCLSLSLSHPSSLVSNSDVYPADAVGAQGTWATFRCICTSLQKQNGHGVMLSVPLIDELINVARRWVTAICSNHVLPSLWQVLMGTWPRSWADKRLLFPLENIITFFCQQAEEIHG